jgi:hypothetical protein
MSTTLRKLFLGLLAGLFGGLVALLLTYFAGVVITAVRTREALATILVAGSFLPLMILFVLLVPTLGLAVLIGLSVGVGSNFSRRMILLIGLLCGIVFGEIVLSGVLPFVIVPQPEDFTSIVSSPMVSGLYGMVMGVTAALLIRRMNRGASNEL